MAMRYAIFGDTGGHASQLLASLLRLGFNSHTFALPADLTVVHLGDLIHKGPASDDLVRIVDQIMRRNPTNWVQLLGNHEAQHVPGAPYFWRCSCSQETLEILHDWRATRRARLAHALAPSPKLAEFAEVGAKDLLLTHAGVTRRFWEERLNEPGTAAAAAELINKLPLDVASQPGKMLPAGGIGRYKGPLPPVPAGHANRLLPVGPLWALSSEEVFTSWFDGQLPFVQVHGHTAAYDWEREGWYPNTPELYRAETYLDPTNRVSYTPVGGSLMVGLDPSFEDYASVAEQPYLLL